MFNKKTRLYKLHCAPVLPYIGISGYRYRFHVAGFTIVALVFLCITNLAYSADIDDLNLNQISVSLIEKSSNLKGELDIVNGLIGVTFTKPIKVSQSCGRSWHWGKRLASTTEKDGFLLLPWKGRAEINFKSEQLLSNCIGEGTRLSFSSLCWIPFFGNEYKNGGFSLQNDGFHFWKGTQGRLEDGKIYIFDGTAWVFNSNSIKNKKQ